MARPTRVLSSGFVKHALPTRSFHNHLLLLVGDVNQAILGPRLYRIHQNGNIQGSLYVQNTAERFGDAVIRWTKVGWVLMCWTSPLLLTVLYRRGMFSVEGLQSLASYTCSMSVVLFMAIMVRAFGRLLNADYVAFLHVLHSAQCSYTAETKKRLSLYDFDFFAWPVDFKWSDISSKEMGKKLHSVSKPINNSYTSFGDKIRASVFNLLAYVAVHTFGKRMLYPGTTALIQALYAQPLIVGRAKLVEEHNGIRAKLRTSDNNDIDTMFVDRRHTSTTTTTIHSTQNGNKLVICCEGNAGFYEVGCMCTPLDAGYSVLGWNHPGFWGSTGVPLPSQEQNAIDAVVQYAIHRLGFHLDQIVLFAWSIGGYSATWAAMSYPDIHCLILDATFDDILPLAYTKMPPSWGGVVRLAVRKYLNLDNAQQLCRYPGPVLLIRRLKDEMITTVDATVLASNRGNELVIKLLQYRYPCLFDQSTLPVIREWLSGGPVNQALLKVQYGVDEETYREVVSKTDAVRRQYPLRIGEHDSVLLKTRLALFLVSKYMEDYDSTHCTPLPAGHFHVPWTEPIC